MDTLCAILMGIFVKKQQIFVKNWLLGDHLESDNFANIPIRLVIPQKPPFGTGMDTLSSILWEIYVKNIKISGKIGRLAAILNLRTWQIFP